MQTKTITLILKITEILASVFVALKTGNSKPKGDNQNDNTGSTKKE